MINSKAILIALFSTLVAACLIAGCGGSGGNSGNNGGNAVTVLATSQHTFNPTQAFAGAGQSVVFRNADFTNHTITADSNGGPNSDGQFPNGLGSNDSYTFVVPAGAVAGTHFFYHCRFHGNAGNGTSLGTGMAGEITVQ